MNNIAIPAVVMAVAMLGAGFGRPAAAEEKDEAAEAIAVLEAAEAAEETADAEAEEEPAEKDAEEEGAAKSLPLRVDAEMVVYEGDSFTCSEKVVIKYGKSEVRCDKVVGTLGEVEEIDKKTGEKKKRKVITHLVATGSPITMSGDGRAAGCLRAVYDLAAGKVVMTGSKEERPWIKDGENTTTADEITFFVHEDPIRVELKKPGINIKADDGVAPLP